MIVLNHNMLDGKIVLLTGAGGGIGFEAAKAFVEMGAKVLIAEVYMKKVSSIVVLSVDISSRFFSFFLIDFCNKNFGTHFNKCFCGFKANTTARTG